MVETAADGSHLMMSEFKGKVLYIVNVASKCGYTESNYASFAALAPHRNNGLEIILAPCNQVGFICWLKYLVLIYCVFGLIVTMYPYR